MLSRKVAALFTLTPCWRSSLPQMDALWKTLDNNSSKSSRLIYFDVKEWGVNSHIITKYFFAIIFAACVVFVLRSGLEPSIHFRFAARQVKGVRFARKLNFCPKVVKLLLRLFSQNYTLTWIIYVGRPGEISDGGWSHVAVVLYKWPPV